MSEVECTGVAASWCARCGDCACPRNKDGEREFERDTCPLHGDASKHAEEPPTSLEAEVARLRVWHPKCSHCGKLAACLGSYESNDAWGYACSECCGHGNEDGCCFPLADIPARYQRLVTRLAALEDGSSTPLAAVTKVVSDWRRAAPTSKHAMLAKLERALSGPALKGRASDMLRELAEDDMETEDACSARVVREEMAASIDAGLGPLGALFDTVKKKCPGGDHPFDKVPDLGHCATCGYGHK